MSRRDAQREATRQRIVDAAVEALIARGAAATTTAEVQRAAGLSRGALLHHFPTREALLAATVSALMERNEAAVREAAPDRGGATDRVERAIEALRAAVVRPAFAAELELWASARTDPVLREVLRREELAARRDLHRVVDGAFGPELAANPRYPQVVAMTVHFLRGLAISGVLRGERGASDQLVRGWAAVVRAIFQDTPLGTGLGDVATAQGATRGTTQGRT